MVETMAMKAHGKELLELRCTESCRRFPPAESDGKFTLFCGYAVTLSGDQRADIARFARNL